jgi:phosphopantothenoylcysteine synthetase/decarboxylase
MKNILLCVSGSISAYKTPSLANKLKNEGYNVKVVLTTSAEKFITKLSFSAQGFETFIDNDEWNSSNVLHIELLKWADSIVISPISANTLAKIANGIADNLLTSIIRAFNYNDKNIYLVPAMNTDMYNHKIINKHFHLIAEFKEETSTSHIVIVEPITKNLACGVTGIGAMAEIDTIVETINKIEYKR